MSDFYVTDICTSTTRRTNASCQFIEHKKTVTYDVVNPGPGIVQPQKGVGVRPVNEIQTEVMMVVVVW
jgi:hypothetical protein